MKWNIKPKLGLNRCIHGEGHGKLRTPEYVTWCQLKQRCFNPKATDYEHYGGRGITVCKRWKAINGVGYMNFLNDMGRRPKGKYSIDRINNDGDYKPSNCRWATLKQQAQNKRRKNGN